MRLTEEEYAAILARRAPPLVVNKLPPLDHNLLPSAPPPTFGTIAGRWLELPLPPTTNNLYRAGTGKDANKRFLSERGRKFKRAVNQLVRLAGVVKPLLGRLRVTLIVHCHDKRHNDIGNREKCLMDALTKAGVWRDDSQIDDIRILRGVTKHGGLARVLIEEINYVLAPLP